MHSLYNFFFIIFFSLSAPFYFLKMWRRGNWQRGFAQRFGRYDGKTKQAITNRHVIWIHAVSVGEVNVATQLVRSLEDRMPNIKIVISTTTSTGMGELKRKLPQHIEKIYYPIDRRRFVQRAIGTIHPAAIVLVEAEIWPNFLWRAFDRNIPVFLVNARLSARSFRGYKNFGFLFRHIFARFSGVGCQNEEDAARLRELGFQPQAIRVVGNLKFDAAQFTEKKSLNVPSLLRQIGVGADAKILVGGSTHAGEEAILARVYQKLRRRFPGLFLILVPRHFERAREAGKAVEETGLRIVYRADIADSTKVESGQVDCLIVNTTGELRYFYEHARVIFVGKSLTAEGGQNPIEPGAMARAMIFGPHMQNFAAIAESFLKGDGAIQVADERGLEEALALLLSDEARCRTVGENALKVVRQNLGAIDRTVDMIVAHLDDGEVYVTNRP